MFLYQKIFQMNNPTKDRLKIYQSQQKNDFSHLDLVNQLQDIQQEQYQTINHTNRNITNLETNRHLRKENSKQLKCTVKKTKFYCCLSILIGLIFILASLFLYFNAQYYPCPSKYLVNYVWVGDRAKIPQKYLSYLQRCKNNVNLLQQKHLQYYTKLWNSHQPQHQIGPQHFPQKKMIAKKADLLRKLYLYYESGIYADFDTEINEECFDGVITNEIIFTNTWGFEMNIVMAEQNFIRVINKKNPLMKYWIIAQLSEAQQSDRWNLCKYKPCFIINCQKHNYDRTWIS